MTPIRSVDALLRLMAWMSPAFPVGAFSYSGGLESAVNDRLVVNAEGLRDWITVLLSRGTLWNDAVLLAEGWRCAQDDSALAEVTELAQAMAGSAERYRETVLLGNAFLEAAAAWPHDIFQRLPKDTPYPVAVGVVAASHNVSLEDVVAAYLHSGVSQLISSGIRLGVAGQKDGVSILAGLERDSAMVANRASVSTLADLGSATILADTAPMLHEIQGTRLFRS